MTIAAAAQREVRDTGASADGLMNAGSRRFYDAVASAWMVKVLPGQYYVTGKSDEILVTILGSCVSACIRDARTGFGGMNHFMLPSHHTGTWGNERQSMRYGNYAMEKLVNEVLKAGCTREEMEIKVFGGGNVIESSSAVGSQNSEFILQYLQSEGLPCAAHDLGGNFPRRIEYTPATGRVVRRLIGGNERASIAREESQYAHGLVKQETYGEIQLFGEDE